MSYIPKQEGVIITNATHRSPVDFSATYTSTTTLTLSGVPFTVSDSSQIVYIKVISSDGTTNVYIAGNENVELIISSNVITITGAGTPFASGDVYEVGINQQTKGYDASTDTQKVTVQNPNYEHYTSVEHIISEADLGITDTATGTDTDTLTDTNHTLATIDFDAEQVAVGYEAYSEGEDVAATVLSITDGDNIETDAITDWTGDVYWLPEVKRFVIDAEGFNLMSIHVRLATDDADNVAYCKIYGTLDENADATDDTYWVDLSSDIFGVAQLSATNDTTEGIYFVDTPTVMLKYMIKIVGEVIGGGASAAAAQDFDVYIKKSS